MLIGALSGGVLLRIVSLRLAARLGVLETLALVSARERARAVDFLFHIFEGTLVLGVVGVEIDGKFELLLALVEPVLFVENYRLIVMPLPSAVVHIVKQSLRLHEILGGDCGFHKVEIAVALAVDNRVLVTIGHSVLISVVQHFEHTRGFRAGVSLVEDVRLIILALFLVRLEYLTLRGFLGNSQNHKRVSWHLSSPLSRRFICLTSPR